MTTDPKDAGIARLEARLAAYEARRKG